MQECSGRYQICGPNVFNRYGLDGQMPNRVYAYNNRISGDRKIGSIELTLIKVADARLGDTVWVRTCTGTEAIYASRARTLIDAVYDWSRFNGLHRAYRWIRSELASKGVTASELVDVTLLRYGDFSTIRRIGVLLEREGVDPKLLRQLRKVLPPSKTLVPWIPRRPSRGAIDPRWGVILNDRT